MKIEEIRREAADLAAEYNWPDQAAAIKAGRAVEGFGREVGQTIALFLERPIVSWRYFPGWSEAVCREHDRKRREHARRLARLRYLLALLGIAKRAGPES